MNVPGKAQIRLLFRNNRFLIFSTLFVAFTLLGGALVYHRFDEGPLRLDPRLLAPQTLALCAGLLLVYFAADGLRLYYTVRALGHRVPLPMLVRLVFVNIFVSNITPMATGGGVVQVWYLRHAGVPLGTAAAATTIRTTLAVLVIFSLTPVFLLSMDFLTQALNWSTRLTLYLVAFIAAYLGVLGVAIFRSRWLLVPVSRLLQLAVRLHLMREPRARRLRFRLCRELVLLHRGFLDFLSGRGGARLLAVFFTLIFLLSLFSFPAVLLHALGYDLEYLRVLGIQTVTTFVMYFAPTPGASGIAEGAFAHFFSNLVAPGHVLLVTFCWRLLTIYLGMFIGFLILKRDAIQVLAWRSGRDV
ncbi:lysylphosphatidylglycerol synthase transmembrane domain-containing protein [Ectothiorhodospira mobilis]|uniref:lysylphosphatidylglycerol synthase transmembrane domain-containing protein n=1 Tax=Ectothiorhodospira mobilis TaxID=195064 RepID=UPI001EE80B61|nr:lysylphosphatidylglycerol synthase transmembrane domain-containing protein [Ectothiorhodospira mobilis]MCG5534591.1 flippase-like domain-containing protein [Ectothiorhodospira mobilis]